MENRKGRKERSPGSIMMMTIVGCEFIFNSHGFNREMNLHSTLGNCGLKIFSFFFRWLQISLCGQDTVR